MRYTGLHLTIKFFGFFCLALLAGCLGSGGNGVRYYLIDPDYSEKLLINQEQQLRIEIIDINVPQYLGKYQIATRSGDNQLKFSENSQWGENLRKNLMRTLARNLSGILSTADISTPISRSSSLPDYTIQINIEQFELGSDGKVSLSANWQLTHSSDEEPRGTYAVLLQSQESINTNDYDKIVALMQEMFGKFSVNIAEIIVSEENK